MLVPLEKPSSPRKGSNFSMDCSSLVGKRRFLCLFPCPPSSATLMRWLQTCINTFQHTDCDGRSGNGGMLEGPTSLQQATSAAKAALPCLNQGSRGRFHPSIFATLMRWLQILASPPSRWRLRHVLIDGGGNPSLPPAASLV